MGVTGLLDWVTAELVLFAGVGLLIGGIDDLLVDLFYLALRPWHRRAGPVQGPPQGWRFAIFVPAWDESRVIGPMLRSTLARLEGDFRLYLGVYPNDIASIAEGAAVAEQDPRVRIVVNPLPGPTTKADNLNAMWRKLTADRAAGWDADVLVLHDAEDLVHAEELAVFAEVMEWHAAVQLPVLPLVRRGSRLVSGHYADEFAEAHGKALTVRRWLRAGVPLAGTGCAIAMPLLDRIAAERDGQPFDRTSLTEDYELGLTLAEMGAPVVLARVPERGGRAPVAVRAYFPHTVDVAVRQKARWMAGIALDGWDRLGWHGGLAERWMRLRDRRAPIAMLVLAAGYAAALLWGVLAMGGAAPDTPGWMTPMLQVNLALFVWRALVRCGFVTHAYGWRQGLLAIPRLLVGNAIDVAAAWRAVALHLRGRAGQAARWDKTAHRFPDAAQLE